MGKIILTERQYRNLNQILIGKEIENNKGRLNEVMTEDEQLNAQVMGQQIQKTLKQCADSDGQESGNWCIQKMNGLLNQLKTHDQFDEASRFTSYWVDSSYTPDGKWATNLGKFLKIFNSVDTGDVPVDKIKAATNFAKYFKVAGGTLAFTKEAVGGAIQLKPMSFTLTWTAPAPAAATPAKPAAGTGKFKTDFPMHYDPNALETWTPMHIQIFQRWVWNKMEENLSLVSGKEGDDCTAKYESALCGGKPCIKSKAVDGKLGSSTKSLITDDNVTKFLEWINANREEANKYMVPVDKCSSTNKGYTAPVKNVNSKSRSRGGVGQTGGGGGANELTGLV
jgi:hypothetical protein